MTAEPFGHKPVLVEIVCELLAIAPGETVVDATVGLGGHARRFAEALGPEGMLIGIDVDPANLERAREALADAPCRVHLLHASFADTRVALSTVGVQSVDVLFADLGVSSTQIDDPERGFSFMRDGPLDMRMDPRLEVTASDLVNRLKERELGDLLYFNAQETASRKIAKRICEVRREGRITTTGQLAQIVADALGVNPTSRKSKIHPATRTFQALRMQVNDEMPALDAWLENAPGLLNTGGRIGVIAFHSVEDRPVKVDFRRRKVEKVYRVVTKKPLIAGPDERWDNPRSRSAKLRVAVRLGDEDTSSLDD